MYYNLPFIIAAVIAVIGIAAMLFRHNLVKVIMGLSLVEAGVNLFLVALGYRIDAIAPIFTNAPSTNMVLPTVQAMTLTNIVIGIATTAMLLSFTMIIYKKYGSATTTTVRKLRG